MKRILSILAIAMAAASASAVDDNTVEIVYSGTTATVTIADNIKSYVTLNSGSSSHVQIIQSSSFAGVDANSDNEDGEIIYSLSGTTTNGSFYMEGSYKCTVELNGVTITNPDSAAVCVMNGKRIALSAKKGTTSTLTDGANDVRNGCYHCKGHTKIKGKGTLNVTGNSKHAIYSKEYIEVKNLTLNITGAVKDAIHCKEYMLIESGTVTISAATDDGIQVEIETDDATTGQTTDHDDENSGNFYQEGGTLTISNFGGKAIKADGAITNDGGTWSGFSSSDNEENASTTGISAAAAETAAEQLLIYDMQGRQVKTADKGLYIFKKGNTTQKVIVK